jgi:hypothetical protein
MSDHMGSVCLHTCGRPKLQVHAGTACGSIGAVFCCKCAVKTVPWGGRQGAKVGASGTVCCPDLRQRNTMSAQLERECNTLGADHASSGREPTRRGG